MAGRRLGHVISGAVTVCVLVSACGGSAALRPADVELQIATGLAEQVGGEFTVACPAEIPAEAGYRFTCSVTDAASGTPVQVEVVEGDELGAFTWKVVPG